MSIIINEKTMVLMQGITGREARIRAKLMLDYGTHLVAGVTPGKGGQTVFDVPVFDTVREAKEHFPEISVTTVFVPAAMAKDAAFEAIDAGIKVVVLMPERMPQQDMLEVIAYSKLKNALTIGPNTIGIISPGKSLVGMIGARVDFANEFFTPGSAGVISRSGGNTTTLCYYLTKEGVGQSTAISVGGDAFIGATWRDLLEMFQEDDETKGVVLYGEIGTSIEEDAAEYIASGQFAKPAVAYVGGLHVKSGMRFGHGGAIISKGVGTVESKLKALKSAGVYCVEHFCDIGKAAKEFILNK